MRKFLLHYRWYSIIGGVLFLVGCAGNQATVSSTIDTGKFETPIAYVQDDAVWIAEHDGSKAQQITPHDNKQYFAPVWFSEGEELLYGAALEEHYEIWKYDIKKQEAILVVGLRERPHTITVSPKGRYIAYFVEDNLFVVDLTGLLVTRLHESAKDVAWSPDGKQLVYTTKDNSLLLQDFTIEGELRNPTILLEQALEAPTYIDDNTLVYEAEWEGQYTLLKLDLHTIVAQPITALRFSATSESVSIYPEPNGKRLLYVRPNEITTLPDAWVLHTELDSPKLILTNIYMPMWSGIESKLYYITSNPVDNQTIDWHIFSATDTGLDKQEILSGHSIVTPAVLRSNEYTIVL